MVGRQHKEMPVNRASDAFGYPPVGRITGDPFYLPQTLGGLAHILGKKTHGYTHEMTQKVRTFQREKAEETLSHKAQKLPDCKTMDSLKEAGPLYCRHCWL